MEFRTTLQILSIAIVGLATIAAAYANAPYFQYFAFLALWIQVVLVRRRN